MTYQSAKIALLGSGHIGGTLAHLALTQHIGNLVLIDVAEGIPQGKALDLAQSAALEGVSPLIQGGQDMALLQGADVVIVTAGVARKPGMTRDDLLSVNTRIMETSGQAIAEFCPDAFVIVITNPLDAMVWVLQQRSGLSPEKVVGMAGVLDSARYHYFLSQALHVSPLDIQGFVLGGHGDGMVPLPRYTSVAGVPLHHFIQQGLLTESQLQDIIQRTRTGGGEIVSLLKTGSAFYAPASSALAMAKSYLRNEKRIFPCAAWLEGAYGMTDIYAGVPVIIGGQGVERILELELTADEQKEFETSVAGVQALVQEAKRFLSSPSPSQ